MSGGGEVMIVKKFYRLQASTMHKTVYPEDVQRISKSVSDWTNATEPRFQKLSLQLDQLVTEAKAKELNLTDPEKIKWNDPQINENGESAIKDPTVAYWVLGINLDGLADSFMLENEKLEFAFKTIPKKDKLTAFVTQVKAIIEKAKSSKNQSH